MYLVMSASYPSVNNITCMVSCNQLSYIVTWCVINTGGPEVVHDLSNYMENWSYELKDPPHLAHRTDKWVGLLCCSSLIPYNVCQSVFVHKSPNLI